MPIATIYIPLMIAQTKSVESIYYEITISPTAIKSFESHVKWLTVQQFHSEKREIILELANSKSNDVIYRFLSDVCSAAKSIE